MAEWQELEKERLQVNLKTVSSDVFSSKVDSAMIHLGCTGGGSWTEGHQEPGQPGQDQGV